MSQAVKEPQQDGIQKFKKKIQKKKFQKIKSKKTSSEWITEVMSQAAKEPQQDGTSQHLLS